MKKILMVWIDENVEFDDESEESDDDESEFETF